MSKLYSFYFDVNCPPVQEMRNWCDLHKFEDAYIKPISWVEWKLTLTMTPEQLILFSLYWGDKIRHSHEFSNTTIESQ